MTDFLTRVAARAMGTAERVVPAPLPRFAPAPFADEDETESDVAPIRPEAVEEPVAAKGQEPVTPGEIESSNPDGMAPVLDAGLEHEGAALGFEQSESAAAPAESSDEAIEISDNTVVEIDAAALPTPEATSALGRELQPSEVDADRKAPRLVPEFREVAEEPVAPQADTPTPEPDVDGRESAPSNKPTVVVATPVVRGKGGEPNDVARRAPPSAGTVPPPIRVHIGTIEVRAVSAAPTPAVDRRAARREPVQSLEDYAERRRGGR